MSALDRVHAALRRVGSRTRDGGRTWNCSAHEDSTASLSTGQGEKGAVLKCHAGCTTENVVAALDMTMADLFDVPRVNGHAPAPLARGPRSGVEVLGPATEAQIRALAYARRAQRPETLEALGVVRVHCYGQEWLGIPALGGSWKCWGLHADGRPRLEHGKLERRNAGSASIIAAPALQAGERIERLYDVEGESDLIAAVEAGIAHALCGTGGASALAGHERHREWLVGLRPAEVAVVGDLDDAGRDGARKRANWWLAQGVPVRIVELPEALGANGDLRDYLVGRAARNGAGAVEPCANALDLERLAELAPLVAPEPEPLVTVPDDDLGRDADALAFPAASTLRGTFAAVVELLRPVTGASEAHVFAATWAALASSIGGARWGSWSGRVATPVYATLLGPTADHKSSAMDRVIDLLPEAVRRIDGATSDAGLFDALEDAAGRPVLLHYDELAFLLRMAAISGQTIDAMLNRLWGAPARLERRLSRRNKDGGARSVERPIVSMLAGSHVETFWRQIEDPDLAIGSGWVNRLVPFVVERGRSLPLTQEPDEQAATAIRSHLAQLAALEPAPVTLASRAQSLWVEYATDHDRRVGELGYPRSAVVKRVRDHVARLALVYATDAGRLVVEPADLLAAIEVSAYLEASFLRLLCGRAPGRGPDRAAGIEATIRSLMARRPRITYRVRDLSRAWPWHPAPSSAELSRALASMDDVEAVRVSGARLPGYRLARASDNPTSDTEPRETTKQGCRMSDDAPRSRATEGHA